MPINKNELFETRTLYECGTISLADSDIKSLNQQMHLVIHQIVKLHATYTTDNLFT